MKTLIKTLMITLLTLTLVTGCSKGNAQGHAGNRSGRAVKIQQEQVQKVTVDKVERENLSLYASFSGQLDGKTDIVVYSEVAGKVTGISKKLGEYVNKGEEIASLDITDYKIKLNMAKADLMAGNAQYEAAEIKYETTEKLFDKGNLSKLELINDKSSFLKAKAGVESAKANLEKAEKDYDNARFTAPVSGYITELNVEQGEFISTGKPVCSIVDHKKLLIKTGISEQDIQKVKNGQIVEITHATSGKKVVGSVTGFGIKPNSIGIYPVEIEFDNADLALMPGMVVEGKIRTSILSDIIYTDIKNLTEEYGRYYIYVVNNENRAERRKVSPGAKLGDKVIITEGLKVGDKVISSGVKNISNGSKVSTMNIDLLSKK